MVRFDTEALARHLLPHLLPAGMKGRDMARWIPTTTATSGGVGGGTVSAAEAEAGDGAGAGAHADADADAVALPPGWEKRLTPEVSESCNSTMIRCQKLKLINKH